MIARLTAIVAGCVLLLEVACRPPPPVEYSILTVINSPAGVRQVLVVRQEQGTAGASATAVFVREKGESQLGDRVFIVRGKPKVEARWTNETRVVIAHDGKKGDVFTSALTSGAISIGYEPLPTLDPLDASHPPK